MNAHARPPFSAVSVADAELVLAALRCTSQRLKLIDNQVIQIGIALKRGLISAERAIDLCEEVAPGCLDLMFETMDATND
jgi:hypothetical protein